jgi:small GTP-binding protein
MYDDAEFELDAPFDPSEFVDEYGNAEPIDLAGGDESADAPDGGPLPVLAIVGRPNVGKSTLVNRILGRREAVVQDVPGVTRDRVSYEANWSGRRFMVMDTGGWEVDVSGLDKRVAEQAEIAVELADAVLLVVDATVGLTDTDEAFVRVLRRSKKPVVLVANKVDNPQLEAEAATLWSLGRTRFPRCTAAAPATCSTRSSPRCPRSRPRRPSACRSAARAGSHWSASRTWASPRCSTGSPGRTAWWWTRPRARQGTRWTS